MYVVVLTVELHLLRLEVQTNAGENAVQVVQNPRGETPRRYFMTKTQ